MNPINIFWFRRDLRLQDNHGLQLALEKECVLPVFIFDPNIISQLPKNDARISFIYERLVTLNKELSNLGSGLQIFHNSPLSVFKKLSQTYSISHVFANEDYEPYARKRDSEVSNLLKQVGIGFTAVKDQVIFRPNEIVKANGSPYTVFTPFKKKWLEQFSSSGQPTTPFTTPKNFLITASKIPSLAEIGFSKSRVQVKDIDESNLNNYGHIRDFPALDQTSYASVHLRFGTVSIRRMVSIALTKDIAFLTELIWREFFMQIIFHFPQSAEIPFKEKYRSFPWKHDKDTFKLWCHGKTGYPMVDAGMRQLNQTGYMHNRARMICASFLCKHLLIDWRWGAAYFARKLLDFDLSANSGNWQWASSTGCDSVPYFRIFNPHSQLQRFDPNRVYIKRWIPELDTANYPIPIVNHKTAREQCLHTFKTFIAN